MKKSSCILLFVFLFSMIHGNSYGAFYVKRKTATAHETTATIPAEQQKKESSIVRLQEQVAAITSFLSPEGCLHPERRHRGSASGWEGTVAMWCGIGGIIYFPPALICALIFGGLGMGPGHRHHRRAVAGVVLGIVGMFLWSIIILIASGAI